MVLFGVYSVFLTYHLHGVFSLCCSDCLYSYMFFYATSVSCEEECSKAAHYDCGFVVFWFFLILLLLALHILKIYPWLLRTLRLFYIHTHLSLQL